MSASPDQLTMPVDKNHPKKKFQMVITLIMLLVVAGGIAFYSGAFDHPAQPIGKTRSPLVPIAARPTLPESGSNTGLTEIASTWGEAKAGMVRDLTDFHAQRQLAEAQKKILELSKEMAVLTAQKKEAELKSMPNVLNAAPIIPHAAPSQAAQAAPEPQKDLPMLRTQKKPSTADEWKLISIQGVSGQLSAIVVNDKGKTLTLRPGSSWRGGRVLSISRQGIMLHREGSNQFMQF